MQVKFQTFFILILAFVTVSSSQSAQAQIRKRIIDGTLAPTSEYPYVGLVSVGDSTCTGTLIGSRYVLSAAHCFFDDRNRRVTNLGNISVTLNGSVFGVSNVTVHPAYVPRSSACIDGELDASLIELSTEPQGIASIPLQRTAPQAGSEILLVGFGVQGTGSSGENNTFPPDGFVNFGRTSIESVDPSYVNWTFDRNRAESNTAGGDSGGPAFLDNGSDRVVNSITCGGTGNAGFNSTSSNTRVDLLAPWVDSIVGTAPVDSAPAFIKLPSQTVGRGQQFSYVLQLTGNGPIAFSLLNALPEGLTLEGATIFGTPTVAGRYNIQIAASNAFGQTSGTLPVTVTEFNPDSALSIDSASINFSDNADDLLSLKGKIVFGKSYSPNRASVKITIAALNQSFRLDRNGMGRKKGGFDFFRLNGKLRNGKFTSTKIGFSAGLGDSENLFDKLDSLFPEDAEDGATAPLPIEITINRVSYNRTLTMRYNAASGVWKSSR